MMTTNQETSPAQLDDEYVQDTQQHIELVRLFIGQVTTELEVRGDVHDASKFAEPERSIFSAGTSRRDSVEYGSEDYRKHMKTVEVALAHHYANNRHHPEHHEDGIIGMNLVDLIEMLCDWMAASMRDAKGDPNQVHHCIIVNQERFGYPDEMAVLLHNTVTHLLEHNERGDSR